MKLRPGTVYDVNENFELEPIQANKQYTDADTLGRNQRLHIAIGVGISEVMLTADASNANYSSNLVAESPIVNHFLKEQDFWRPFLDDVWIFVMDAAIANGELPSNFHDIIEPDVAFPIIIHRDRLQEIQGDTALVAAHGMSSQELSRRHNLDPEQMEEEIARRRADFIPDIMNLNGDGKKSDDDEDDDEEDGEGDDKTKTDDEEGDK